MKGYFTDSHCHLSDERIFSGAGAFIAKAEEAGVHGFVLAGTHPEEWLRQLDLKKRFPEQVILNFGLHPWWVEMLAAKDSALIEDALAKLQNQIIFADGLGETGLDFATKRNALYFKEQERCFRAQIQIARLAKKPLVLHIVHAHERAIKILDEERGDELPLIVHSYSGNATQLKEYIQRGAFISFSGAIVRTGGYEKVKKACAQTPLDRVLFETDSPDQSWGVDGAQSEPAQVPEVYRAGARLLQVSLETLQQKVADNLRKIGYYRP